MTTNFRCTLLITSLYLHLLSTKVKLNIIIGVLYKNKKKNNNEKKLLNSRPAKIARENFLFILQFFFLFFFVSCRLLNNSRLKMYKGGILIFYFLFSILNFHFSFIFPHNIILLLIQQTKFHKLIYNTKMLLIIL